MKCRVKLLISTIIVAVVFAACSNATSNNPNEVLQQFFKHLAKKDIDGASKYVTKDSKPTLEMMKKGLDMAEKMKDSLPQNDPMKDFEDVNFAPAKIENDSAFIVVSSKTKSRPDVTFNLIKKSDGWKVDFTMKTLMRMGKESVQENDNINFNSEEMESGVKMADSILKNMDPKVIDELQKQLENLK